MTSSITNGLDRLKLFNPELRTLNLEPMRLGISWTTKFNAKTA
jgi:hypothetical protein